MPIKVIDPSPAEDIRAQCAEVHAALHAVRASKSALPGMYRDWRELGRVTELAERDLRWCIESVDGKLDRQYGFPGITPDSEILAKREYWARENLRAARHWVIHAELAAGQRTEESAKEALALQAETNAGASDMNG